MRIKLAFAAALAFAPLAAGNAYALGCVSGGAAGAVAGHVAGHHAVLGAVGGCIAGHEINKHNQNVAQQQQNAAQRPGNQAIPSNTKGN